MRWKSTLMTALMTMALALPALAQPGPPPGAGRGGPPAAQPAVKERVRLRLLQRRVGLDEPTARRVIEVLRSHEQKREVLANRLKDQKRELGRLVRTNSADQSAYQRAIDGLLRTQQEMETLRREEFAALRRVLTPQQQGKLLVELNRLMRRGRNAEDAGSGPWGPGGGGRGRGPRRGPP